MKNKVSAMPTTARACNLKESLANVRYALFLNERKNEMQDIRAATKESTTKAFPSLPAHRCSPI